jgi:hypothetical protein
MLNLYMIKDLCVSYTYEVEDNEDRDCLISVDIIKVEKLYVDSGWKDISLPLNEKEEIEVIIINYLHKTLDNTLEVW